MGCVGESDLRRFATKGYVVVSGLIDKAETSTL